MTQRIILRTKDIAQLEGISISAATSKHARLKKIFKKLPHQRITIDEYCEYFGFEVESVTSKLK